MICGTKVYSHIGLLITISQMESPKEPVQLARDKAFILAVQLLNSGAPANEVMNQIKQQGLPDNQVREVMRDAFLETNKELLQKGADVFTKGSSVLGLLKTGVPLVILATIVISYFATPLLGIPLGLGGGITILVIQIKNRIKNQQ